MLIIPAIDIMEGKVVRLERGDFERANIYALAPVDYARKWRDEGARFLHLVDLDGARCGEPKNFSVIAQLLRETGVPSEVGGGIRSPEAVCAYLGAGVERVVLSTKVVEDNTFLSQPALRGHTARIAVSIDIKQMATPEIITTATGGWLKNGDILMDIPSFIADIAASGVRHVNFSDVLRDGTMKGPDIQKIRNFLATARAASRQKLFFTYAGGISTLDDIRALISLGAEGVDAVIVGKALYEGRFSLKEALAAAGPC